MSIFTAECVAVNDALNIALNNVNDNYYILTDSLSLILSLRKPKIDIKTNHYIYEIIQKYNEFHKKTTNGSKIEIVWIPAHADIKGNELADTLAKTATDKNADNNILTSFTDFTNIFKMECNVSTRRVIEEEGKKKGRIYFDSYYKNTKKPWFHKKNLPREIIVSINRFRSGHYNLAKSLCRIGIFNSEECDCNYVTQDLNHVIWQCPLFDTQRIELINKLGKNKLYLPLDIHIFLIEPNIKALEIICDFLTKCNLKI